MVLPGGRIDALADPAEESGEVLARLAFALEPKPLGDRHAEVDVSRPGAAVESWRTPPAAGDELLKSSPDVAGDPDVGGQTAWPPIARSSRPAPLTRGQFAVLPVICGVGAMSVVPLSEKMSWFTEIWAVTRDNRRGQNTARRGPVPGGSRCCRHPSRPSTSTCRDSAARSRPRSARPGTASRRFSLPGRRAGARPSPGLFSVSRSRAF